MQRLEPAVEDLGEAGGRGHSGHGYARLLEWTLLSAESTPRGSVRLALGLEADAPLASAFPHAFSLRLDLKLDEALDLALKRGTLLSAELEIGGSKEICYFLNSPRGRAAVRAIQSGQWKITEPLPTKEEITQPNIFQLYEQNIGPLSPIIADELGEAQDAFPDEWITEAFRIAVDKDKRSWRYVLAILERWQREGYHGRKEKSEDRRSSPEARRRYIEGEFSEHIEH
jgi:DnaD/phage-associated family protein